MRISDFARQCTVHLQHCTCHTNVNGAYLPSFTEEFSLLFIAKRMQSQKNIFPALLHRPTVQKLELDARKLPHLGVLIYSDLVPFTLNAAQVCASQNVLSSYRDRLSEHGENSFIRCHLRFHQCDHCTGLVCCRAQHSCERRRISAVLHTSQPCA